MLQPERPCSHPSHHIAYASTAKDNHDHLKGQGEAISRVNL
ncbi:hypothetical protein DCAR_0205893 [Daucus carota subsp. sativus]|uniref:Uncharacterized protein n=1 Tax=Daucus carota subsp. sativus TaxID=79200 RepID=A0A166CW16_DAUCS|nr:hypothetical protein DCAR_0205893 [Daucus carota subsp. sativus]